MTSTILDKTQARANSVAVRMLVALSFLRSRLATRAQAGDHTMQIVLGVTFAAIFAAAVGTAIALKGRDFIRAIENIDVPGT